MAKVWVMIITRTAVALQLNVELQRHSDVMLPSQRWSSFQDYRYCPSYKAAHFFSEDECSIFQSLEDCETQRAHITWLASYPCSGNTWLRVLLQSITAIYNGAVYNDARLIEAGLLGEKHYDPKEVLGVKTHYPFFDTAADLIAKNNSRALFLIRDPLSAALSYCSLQLGKSHHKEVLEDELRKEFDRTRDALLKLWLKVAEFYLSDFGGRVLVVRYEDMVEKTNETLATKVLPFFGINSTNPVVRGRLECAVGDGENQDSTRREHSYTFKFTRADQQAAADILGDLPKSFGY